MNRKSPIVIRLLLMGVGWSGRLRSQRVRLLEGRQHLDKRRETDLTKLHRGHKHRMPAGAAGIRLFAPLSNQVLAACFYALTR